MQEGQPPVKFTMGQKVEIFGLVTVVGSVLLIYLSIVGFLYWGTRRVPATPEQVPVQFKGVDKPEVLRLNEKHPTSSPHSRH